MIKGGVAVTITQENCMGCGLCAAECPKGAISFTDENGFILPVIDRSACVDCGKCVKVCKKDLKPVLSTRTKAFAAWSQDAAVRSASTSGGVAYEIAKHLLGEGYTYLGIEMDCAELKAKAYVTTDVAELGRSQGSKYISTWMYPAIAELKQKDKLLIIDVPCHIGAYDSWLKARGMRDKAILVDMFCAGPCNSLVLKKQIQELCAREEKKQEDITSIGFRSKKKYGWGSNLAVAFRDGTEIQLKNSEADFFKLFYSDAFHSEACYRCEYDTNRSYADIRIGDYWGQKFAGNREGVSAVLAFTEAGEALVRALIEKNVLQAEEVNAAGIYAGQLDKPQRKTRHYGKLQKELQTEKSLKEIRAGVMKPVLRERKIRAKAKRMLMATKLGFCKKIAKRIKK